MSSPLSDSQKDQILNDFIQLAQNDSQLKEEIKSSRNQDELITIAEQRGYHFDSLTLLRKWSEHTDFSQPTWMGWFAD
ncbi:Nif11-like leader peptide family natural product precursor [Synechococcus sp. AH-601-N10]|nr:Nif11-like leader peptide family natural product precursor [Synechococcus sp. AH-601-N10]